jgi:hypothetical protein
MEVEEITSRLQKMQADPTMTTKSIYSPTADEYDDNRLPFVQIHLLYLRKHQQVNPLHYLSNLAIMIKKR